MHAAAARMAARVLCLCVAVSVVNMVSVEMDAGNEKPRTGVGAGFLIESGFFSATRQLVPHLWAR